MSEQLQEQLAEPEVEALTDYQIEEAAIAEIKEKHSVDAEPENVEAKVEETTDRYSKAFNTLTKREQKLAADVASNADMLARIKKVEESAESFTNDPGSYIRAQIAVMLDTDDTEMIEDAYTEAFDKQTFGLLDEVPEKLKELTEFQALNKKIDKLEQEVANKEQAVINGAAQLEVRNSLDKLKDSRPFLFSQGEDPTPHVWDLIQENFKYQMSQGVESPKMLTVEQASQLIETNLQETAQYWVDQSAKANTQNKTGHSEDNSPSARTLTNRNASTVPPRTSDTYIESEEEAIERIKEKYR